VKYNLLFQNYCATTSTWAYKYSKISKKRNMKGRNKNVKIQNMKHERNKKKAREMQKEKEIKRK